MLFDISPEKENVQLHGITNFFLHASSIVFLHASLWVVNACAFDTVFERGSWCEKNLLLPSGSDKSYEN